MCVVIVLRLHDSILLLITKFIGHSRRKHRSIKLSVIFSEIIEVLFSIHGDNFEPFVLFTIFLFKSQFSQIFMELLVLEGLICAFIHSVALPLQLCGNIRRMRLLVNTLFNIVLLGIANLGPAVVTGNFRSSVSVNLWNNRFARLNIYIAHIRSSPLPFLR